MERHKTIIMEQPGGKPHSVRRHVLIPLAIGLLLLVATAVLVREDEYQNYLEQEAVERTQVVKSAVEQDAQNNARLMVSLLHGLAGNPELSQAYLAGDRQVLFERAKPLYDEMTKIGIAHLYFHDVDGRVFLRVHHPDEYGDVITRATMKQARETGSFATGYERGPFAAFAQRTVSPWNVGGKRVGYIELSMDLADSASRVNSLLDVDLFAIVDKTQVSREAWQAALKRSGREGNWDEFKNVVIVDRTQREIQPQMAAVIQQPPSAEPYELLHLDDGRTLVAQSIPLDGSNGLPLGRLAVFSDASDVADDHARALWLAFGGSATIALVLFVFFLAYAGRIERRLNQKHQALEAGRDALAVEIKVRRAAEAALQAEQERLEEKVLERTKELSDANTALREQVAARTRAQQQLAEAQRIGKVGSWEVDLTTGRSKWSDESFRIYGLEPGEVAEPDMEFFFSMVHPDDREAVLRNSEQGPRDGEHQLTEHRIVRKDGSVRDILNNMEFEVAPDGRPLRISGTCQDITERKNAERHQLRLEEQLRAAQKMEAVGNLAGGIAHDFNNLLSVILSYVSFVLEELPQVDARRADLLEVQRAAERAAALTRQLLAFGRKQVLQPVPLDLNHVVGGMQKMLRRIIGEDVSMEQHLDPALGLTLADPGQIEQVLMNLVVNARDAMPAGGCLTIDTANMELHADQEAGLKAGHYVALTVSDTGVGMDKATLQRLFEPFFTTKEVGKGTGLGLSTVYGIVKQSGGNVTVYSERGVGSRFRVYLPRDMSARPLDRRHTTRPLRVVGEETILLVEDEPAVRASAQRILGDAGYTVLTAENGQDALHVCRAYAGSIDLVLTDVVMPKLGGAMFARELEKLLPGTRVLFMSGYSGDAIAHHGMLDKGVQFIGKPFNAAALTRKVREVLDSDPQQDPTDFAMQRKEAC